MNYQHKNFYKDNIFISLDGLFACKKIGFDDLNNWK